MQMNPKEKQDSFQQNMVLQQIANYKKQLTAGIIEKRMREELFPTKTMTRDWKAAVRCAIMNSSPITYQAKLTDFAEAVVIAGRINNQDWDGKITIGQFQVLANALDAVSPNTLGVGHVAYKKIIEETVSLVEIWNKLINDINQTAFAEAETEYKMRAAADKNIPQLAHNGLKTVDA
jgi:hypothetical protein